jgi:TonB family protein
LLDTLNAYIDKGEGESGTINLPVGGRWDRRFPIITVASVAGHITLFSLALTVSLVTGKIARRHNLLAPDEKVVITGIARAPLRLPPEAPEQVDTSHLAYNPNVDDTHLIARSINPGLSHGTGMNQLPTGTHNQRAGGTADTASIQPATRAPRKDVQPPSISPVQINQQTQPDSPVTASIAPSKPVVQTPPAPQIQKDSPAATAKTAEDSGAASRLGFQAQESQYFSYVRAKIYKENNRIMPKQWIETVLAGEVSADFSVLVERGGRLRSVRLVRSCGYSTLDDVARQAIYLASPFEGFPQQASDPLEVKVTVHYTPYR